MNSNYLIDPIVFLIDTLFSLYILAVLLRFLLQYSGTHFYNPISQFLIKITQPPLKLLRRFVPAAGQVDSASLVLVLGLQMLADFSILLLKGVTIGIVALVILAITQLIALLINIFIFAVFARALLTWINPVGLDAANAILINLTEPLLNKCRKFIPDIAGIDFTPLVVLLLLQLAKMVILPPLHGLASLVG
jgi:YggT family protein